MYHILRCVGSKIFNSSPSSNKETKIFPSSLKSICSAPVDAFEMAAISMNDSLHNLMERTLLMTSLFSDENEILVFKDDIAAGHATLKSLKIIQKALLEMKEEKSLHSYITGSRVTFPTLKPKVAEVS